MDALQLTREMVAFDSTSVLSNIEISRYVEDTLRRIGFETEWIEYRDDAGVPKANVVGKKGTGHGGLAYFGHTDVVPADQWFTKEHTPYDAFVQDERLYGRGSCDMKGSVACMMEAAARFNPDELREPIYIICTADEETGYVGAYNVSQRSRFYKEILQHDTKGIIGEPTRLEVVHSHKGAYLFTATSHGRAGHSSTNFGVNANLKMIPFLQEMKAIHDECESNPEWQDNRFDPPTVSWNIGINDFTRAINITAPQSVCTVYFRPMPNQDPELLVRRAEAAAKRCGVDFQVTRRCPSLYIDPQSPYVQAMLKLSGKQAPQTVCYGTDGCVFAEVPNLIVFGPGDIAQAHTHDEWIALQQLTLGAEMYARFIRHWCRESRN